LASFAGSIQPSAISDQLSAKKSIIPCLTSTSDFYLLQQMTAERSDLMTPKASGSLTSSYPLKALSLSNGCLLSFPMLLAAFFLILYPTI